MNGLRIYIRPSSADLDREDAVFFSRRADGPFYRWSYEERVGQWHYARVNALEVTYKELNITCWKGLPASLQARLRGHYLE